MVSHVFKIGLQTIPWGDNLGNLNELCQRARSLGFTGLEFAQRVEQLGDAQKLVDTLQKNDMTLIGFSGGSLRRRIEYAEIAKPEYLYLDEWDVMNIPTALEKKIKIGLHPHYYKTIEKVADAARYLPESELIKLLLDNAHLYLAGEDMVEALKTYSQHVIAVHLNDWTSQYGRDPQRYPQGFTALGMGELGDQLEAVITHLLETQYAGWIIVKQDTAHGDPFDSIKISCDWLRKHGMFKD